MIFVAEFWLIWTFAGGLIFLVSVSVSARISMAEWAA